MEKIKNIVIYPTRLCDRGCLHCFGKLDHPYSKTTELSLDHVIANLSSVEGAEISISGSPGEPSQYSDLVRLVRHLAAQRPSAIHIITNMHFCKTPQAAHDLIAKLKDAASSTPLSFQASAGDMHAGIKPGEYYRSESRAKVAEMRKLVANFHKAATDNNVKHQFRVLVYGRDPRIFTPGGFSLHAEDSPTKEYVESLGIPIEKNGVYSAPLIHICRTLDQWRDLLSYGIRNGVDYTIDTSGSVFDDRDRHVGDLNKEPLGAIHERVNSKQKK